MREPRELIQLAKDGDGSFLFEDREVRAIITYFEGRIATLQHQFKAIRAEAEYGIRKSNEK